MGNRQPSLHLWFMAAWLAYGILRAITLVGVTPVVLASLLAYACRWAAGQGLIPLGGGD